MAKVNTNEIMNAVNTTMEGRGASSIRRALKIGVPAEKLAHLVNPNLAWYEIENEVSEIMQAHVDARMAEYENRGLRDNQLQYIRDAFRMGNVDNRVADLYAEGNLTSEQMNTLNRAVALNFTYEQIKAIANPEFTADEMVECMEEML